MNYTHTFLTRNIIPVFTCRGKTWGDFSPYLQLYQFALMSVVERADGFPPPGTHHANDSNAAIKVSAPAAACGWWWRRPAAWERRPVVVATTRPPPVPPVWQTNKKQNHACMHDERLRLRRAAATMHQSGRQWQGGILLNLVRARPALALAHARALMHMHTHMISTRRREDRLCMCM